LFRGKPVVELAIGGESTSLGEVVGGHRNSSGSLLRAELLGRPSSWSLGRGLRALLLASIGCEAAMQPGVLNQLEEAGGELSVQLYQRVPKSSALPTSFRKLMR